MLVSSEKKNIEQICYNPNIACQFNKYIWIPEKKGINACVVDFILGNITMGLGCDIKDTFFVIYYDF